MKRFILFLCLAALAVPASAAQLLVSDRATGQVLKYDYANGNFLGVLVDNNLATNGGLLGPSALTLGPGGDLLVASQQTGQVLRYNAKTGDYLGVFAGDVFGGASGLLYDAARDRVYVSELGNFDAETVRVYNGAGVFQGTFGTGAGASGRTSLKIGPDGHLYVGAFATDAFFSGEILRFNADTLEFMDVFASVPGQLAGANGFVFRALGGGDYTLDVVGLFSSTLARFNVTTDGLGDLAVTSGGLFIPPGNLLFPSQVILGADGNLLVSNLGNDNLATGPLAPGSVGRFDIDTGAFLGTFLAPGGPDNLLQPTDMLVIPEPATVIMAGLGLGMLLVVRLRRK